MEKKWFVALLMVVVMVCACWTGAGADEEHKIYTSRDYWYSLLDMARWRLRDIMVMQKNSPFQIRLVEKRLLLLVAARFSGAIL